VAEHPAALEAQAVGRADLARRRRQLVAQARRRELAPSARIARSAPITSSSESWGTPIGIITASIPAAANAASSICGLRECSTGQPITAVTRVVPRIMTPPQATRR
jgi:hypothetical protein